MKISFIVPVYGVEQYLRQCVESITKQDYRNIEVILVDDESPDGCPALCEELKLEDDRVKVVHQPHGGLSNARNTGLEYVTGDYLMYVDSDDYLLCEQGVFDRIVKTIIINGYPDFVGLNFVCVSSRGVNKRHHEYEDEVCRISQRDYVIRHFVLNGYFPSTAWAKLIKVDFARDSGLAFLDNHIGEEVPWFLDLLDRSKNCMFCNEYIYAYRTDRQDSIMHTLGCYYYDSLLSILSRELEKLELRSFNNSAHEYIFSCLACQLCCGIMRLYKLPKRCQSRYWERMKDFIYLIDYDSHPKIRLVNRFRKIFGLEITKSLLQFYDRIRTLAQSRI